MIDPDFALEVAKPSLRRPWYSLSVWGAIKLIVVVGCVLGLTAWLARAVADAREAARRSQCVCNFCQITLALINYHDIYGSLPPAHVDDAQGRPLYSWRVLILPQMEHSTLYNAFNLSEPWDSPGNSKLLGMMPHTFACPSRSDVRGGSKTSLTSYVAVTGPGTAFPDGKTVRFADFKDGTSRTLLAVEVENVDIAWTEPRDLDVRTMSLKLNDPARAGISSKHYRGANVSFADGGKKFMTEGISPRDLKAMMTIDGGEEVDVEAALSRR
jgi:prepilin-type processing-associated H-X9-DG protein